MSEVVRSFAEPVRNSTGRYHARAVGRQGDDRLWEGWFEFEPLDEDTPVVVGPVESRQPDREALVYWASGLTAIYLEGALDRALNPLTVRVNVAERPVSDAPASRMHPLPAASLAPEPVLDPFEVGGRNLDILRQELTALNRPRLLNIIAAFDLNPGGEDVSALTDMQLMQFIVTATEVQMRRRVTS